MIKNNVIQYEELKKRFESVDLLRDELSKIKNSYKNLEAEKLEYKERVYIIDGHLDYLNKKINELNNLLERRGVYNA